MGSVIQTHKGVEREVALSLIRFQILAGKSSKSVRLYHGIAKRTERCRVDVNRIITQFYHFIIIIFEFWNF